MKTVGVIGGMGPKATVDFLNKVISLTPAKCDQDHIRMIIDLNPKIPDRSTSILGRGPSPLSELINSAKILEKCGAHFIVIPCVSAHYWLKAIQRAINIPILNVIEVSLKRVEREPKKIKTIGILATTGVIKSKIFNKIFEPEGYKIIAPTPAKQKKCVMRGIYKIKEGEDPKKVNSLFLDVAENLILKSAQLIILACTEIPLAIKKGSLPVPMIDINEVLAEETVICAFEN